MNQTLELIQDREEYLPQPEHDGDYKLINLESGIVQEVKFLRACAARNLNCELRADYAACRWIPFLENLP